MKIIKQDTKEGIIEIVPETLDDLWHLSHIIVEGDNASSKTPRRIQDNTADQLRRLLDEYRTTNAQSINFDTIIQEQTTALVTKLDQLINVIQRNNTTSNISKASSMSNNMAYNMMRIKNLATFNNR